MNSNIVANGGRKLNYGGFKMDQQKLFKVIDWARKHETTLKDLFEQFKADTSDTKTTFVEFCVAMYDECKH